MKQRIQVGLLIVLVPATQLAMTRGSSLEMERMEAGMRRSASMGSLSGGERGFSASGSQRGHYLQSRADDRLDRPSGAGKRNRARTIIEDRLKALESTKGVAVHNHHDNSRFDRFAGSCMKYSAGGCLLVSFTFMAFLIGMLAFNDIELNLYLVRELNLHDLVYNNTNDSPWLDAIVKGVTVSPNLTMGEIIVQLGQGSGGVPIPPNPLG